MRLSEIRERQQDRTAHQDLNPQVGTIRQATAYPKPIDGVYQGRSVRILASGDVVGMSPACQIVDENGRLDWVSADDVQITQRRFLPATNRSDLRQRSAKSSPTGTSSSSRDREMQRT